MKNIDKIGLIASGAALIIAITVEHWVMIPFFIASAYFFGWVER